MVGSAALYFACFYRFREPFGFDAYDAFIVAPSLIAIFLARKSWIFLWVWSGLFVLWTLYVYSHAYGIDVQNGCEACDYGVLLMAVVSWLSLIPAIFIWILHQDYADAAKAD
jgi:hypothetical protein